MRCAQSPHKNDRCTSSSRTTPPFSQGTRIPTTRVRRRLVFEFHWFSCDKQKRHGHSIGMTLSLPLHRHSQIHIHTYLQQPQLHPAGFVSSAIADAQAWGAALSLDWAGGANGGAGALRRPASPILIDDSEEKGEGEQASSKKRQRGQQQQRRANQSGSGPTSRPPRRRIQIRTFGLGAGRGRALARWEAGRRRRRRRRQGRTWDRERG